MNMAINPHITVNLPHSGGVRKNGTEAVYRFNVNVKRETVVEGNENTNTLAKTDFTQEATLRLIGKHVATPDQIRGDIAVYHISADIDDTIHQYQKTTGKTLKITKAEDYEELIRFAAKNIQDTLAPDQTAALRISFITNNTTMPLPETAMGGQVYNSRMGGDKANVTPEAKAIDEEKRLAFMQKANANKILNPPRYQDTFQQSPVTDMIKNGTISEGDVVQGGFVNAGQDTGLEGCAYGLSVHLPKPHTNMMETMIETTTKMLGALGVLSPVSIAHHVLYIGDQSGENGTRSADRDFTDASLKIPGVVSATFVGAESGMLAVQNLTDETQIQKTLYEHGKVLLEKIKAAYAERTNEINYPKTINLR